MKVRLETNAQFVERTLKKYEPELYSDSDPSVITWKASRVYRDIFANVIMILSLYFVYGLFVMAVIILKFIIGGYFPYVYDVLKWILDSLDWISTFISFEYFIGGLFLIAATYSFVELSIRFFTPNISSIDIFLHDDDVVARFLIRNHKGRLKEHSLLLKDIDGVRVISMSSGGFSHLDMSCLQVKGKWEHIEVQYFPNSIVGHVGDDLSETFANFLMKNRELYAQFLQPDESISQPSSNDYI